MRFRISMVKFWPVPCRSEPVWRHYIRRDLHDDAKLYYKLDEKVIETERLLLRPPNATDLPAWTDFLSDTEATKFIGGQQNAAGAWRNLCVFAGAWSIQGFSNFSVIEKATGRWIGRAGPWFPPGWVGPEIGWAFCRDVWGRGYATEAAIRCLDWVFEELGWKKAVHIIHPDNAASVAVATRIGASMRSSETADGNLIYVSTKKS